MAYLTKGSQLALCAFVGVVLAVCFVSGITGDVPDDVVYTDLHKTVQLGDRAVLKCLFYGTPLAVFWKKGNDPRTAPNLITRIEGEYDLGSCVQDKTCEMNDDYSLTIKNVTIADQGRYICRVSNYMGILIHGYTDFKVYATPEEPYPFINECKENGKNCTVSAQDPLNITCSASRYFPKIDLLFLHGGQKVSTIETVEWENDDGTKSKLIFTRVPPSKIPYVCMAFNIPGSQDERTSTISVFDHHANTTFGEPPETNLTRNFKIGLSVGLSIAAGVVVCILVVGLVKTLCKKCRGRERKISYYELWFLADKMTKSPADESKLRNTFKYLKFTAVIREVTLTQLEAYQALCQWKEENKDVNQPKDLKEALVKFSFNDVFTKMMDERGNVNKKVSQETMKHILWSIGDIEKMNQFLRQLTSDRETINTKAEMAFVVEAALRKLNAWSNGSFQINPVILMSKALEFTGCTPLDKLLFTVPDKLMAPIQDEKLREFTDKLTGRHCKRLDMTLKISNLKKIDDFIFGNHHYVFDTRSLIAEWLLKVECSNYEKRRRLDDAVNKIGRYDLQDFFKKLVDRPNAKQPRVELHYLGIFDDDIPQFMELAKWLPHEKKTQLKEKIGLPDEKNDDDEDSDDDTLKDQIKAWRDSITTPTSDKVSIDEALKEFQSFRKELTNNTTYTELTLTDGEIETVSSNVTSTDEQHKLTSILHIDAVHVQNDSFVGQLKLWRNTQAKENCRNTLQKALEQIGIAECIVSKGTRKQLDQEELARIAFNLMMEDVRLIINVLDIDEEKVKSYVRQWNNKDNCTTGLLVNLKKESRNREDFCKALRNAGFIDIARSVYFGKNV